MICWYCSDGALTALESFGRYCEKCRSTYGKLEGLHRVK